MFLLTPSFKKVLKPPPMFYVLIQIWVFILFCLALYFFKVYEHNSRLKINERGQIKTTAEIELDELVKMYH